jgi:hypothetical protein
MLGRNDSANVHAWVEERLCEYLDKRLAATERAPIEQHLRECADCRASFGSLRWTIGLAKQAPAPALPRAFTLPVPRRAPQPSFAFGFAQFATALATLLLLAVIGVDVITQLGGGMTAMAPSAAKEFAAPTLAVAAAPPQAAEPTKAAEILKAPAPTAAPKPTEAPKPAAPIAPTAAPQPTMAPPAALPAPLNVLPSGTVPRAVGVGAPETPETKGAADSAEKARSATAALRSGFAITATATIPAPIATLAPTPTATAVPPTATAVPSPTAVAQARAEATRAPQPTQVPLATAQPLATPLRVVEVGLLFLVAFFGALVVVMWRKK